MVDGPIIYKNVSISISETIFPGDLIQFDLLDFDIILGMSWLHTYGAKIDCSILRLFWMMWKVEKYVSMDKGMWNLVP